MPNPTVHIIATGGSIAGVGPDRTWTTHEFHSGRREGKRHPVKFQISRGGIRR